MESVTKLGQVSLVPRGMYDSSMQYERLDVVSYEGSSYLVLHHVQGVPPADGTDYMLLAERGESGPMGEQGPIGLQGLQGPPGADGTSFVVKGRFDTLIELEAAHPAGQAGDAYAVGTPEENRVYIWSEDDQVWQDVGSIQGPAGEPGPEGKQGPEGPQGPEGKQGPPGSTEAADAAAQAAQAAAQQATAAAVGKQDKLTGRQGQVVGFGADGVAVSVPGWSNPNLLDNWYFADPVNRRGRMEYTNGYTIDRWRSYVGTPLVTLTADGIQLTAGDWGQPISQAALVPAVYTCSVLLTGNKLITLTMDAADGVARAQRVVDQETGFVLSFAYKWTTDAHLFYLNSNSSTNKAVAAKLELCPIQTLAHQNADGAWVLNDPPPNRALELLKCQRYQYIANAVGNPVAVFGMGPASTSKKCAIMIPIPGLRTFPTISTSGGIGLLPCTREDINENYIPVTNFAPHRNGTTGEMLMDVTAEGLIPGDSYFLVATNDSSSKLIFDANL